MSLPFDAEFYRSILEKTNTGIYITDACTDEIVYMNQQMKQMFQVDHVEGRTCWQVLQRGQTGRCEFCRIGELMTEPGRKACVWRQRSPVTGRIYLHHDSLEKWNGRLYHVQNSIDVTDQVQLSRVAAYDELTGILNRKAGKKRLNDLMEGLRGDELCTVVLYDIDGLKWVNDTFGHLEGDRLLLFVAKNIQQNLKENDFVFRLSGDEFIIVFRDMEPEQVEGWMDSIRGILKGRRPWEGMDYDVSFSYGMVCVRAGEHFSVSDALSIADTQMYMKKRDFHIMMGQRKLREDRGVQREHPAFTYNKDRLFEALTESLDDYAFVGNLKTGEFMYSSRMAADFDLPGQVIPNAAAFWGEKIHPDDVNGFLRSNQEVTDGRTERHAIAYRARDAHGQWVQLLCKGRMIRDSQGEPDLFAGIIRNLDSSCTRPEPGLPCTDLTGLEELLPPVLQEDAEGRQEEPQIHGCNMMERELKFLAEKSRDGIFEAWMSEGFPLLYANEGYFRLHGYTREQFFHELNNQASLVVYEEDLAGLKKQIENLIQNRQPQVVLEYRIVKREGSIAWVHVNAGLVMREDGTVVMMGMILDITERRSLEERLLRTQKLFQIARKHTRLNMWEYDIRRRRIIHTDGARADQGYNGIVENVPESLIENGCIHPDSVEAFRELYRRVEAGEDGVSAQLRVKRRDTDQDYWWEKVTYIQAAGEGDTPYWAVGVSEDISRQKEAESRILEEESIRQLLSRSLLLGFQLNLTHDRLEKLHSRREPLGGTELIGSGYEALYHKICASIASESDRKRYESAFSPERLKERVEKGMESAGIEFRQLQEDGRILWVTLSFRVILSARGDRILLGYLKNTDQQKKRELALKQKAMTDEVSGFYHHSTARLMISEVLESGRKPGGMCAVLILDIDHFREVNRRGGVLSGDRILGQMSSVIRRLIPSSSIVSRVGADVFQIFYSSVRSREWLTDSANRLRESLCGSYPVGEQEQRITVSAGLAFFLTEKVNYDQIGQYALEALEGAKRRGGNCLEIYRRIMPGTEGAAGSRELDECLEACRVLVETGYSRREVCRALLEKLGSLFQAARASVLEPSDKGALEPFAQWEEKRGRQTDCPPAPAGPEACDRGKEKLLLDVEDDGHVLCRVLLEGLPSPVRAIEAERVKRFLRRLNRLYLLREQCDYLACHDTRTGLLNYESYSRYMESGEAQLSSSFGMLHLRIAELGKYNLKYGRTQGDVLIRLAAEWVKEFFGHQTAFRISPSSFCVLCPDMAYEKFRKLCGSLRQRTEEERKGCFVCAGVWQAGPVDVEQMLGQLEEKLQAAMLNRKNMEKAADHRTISHILKGIQHSMKEGRFCTFLQPKADTRTGKICGAEALVRYQDPDKGLIPPARFLPAIEQAGLIRYVDLFVLSDVCRMVRKWQEQGWKPFPISLNFSRTTILEPGILERVNRITEEHGVPRELIEIEVTETVGSIDSASLKSIVDQFIEAGYQIALDDFGTEYSSIYVLYSLGLHSLKLDRKIVQDIYHDSRARLVARDVINLCRKLCITSVAEGVETAELLEVLREMDCDVIQGYLLNKPLPEKDFREQYIKN